MPLRCSKGRTSRMFHRSRTARLIGTRSDIPPKMWAMGGCGTNHDMCAVVTQPYSTSGQKKWVHFPLQESRFCCGLHPWNFLSYKDSLADLLFVGMLCTPKGTNRNLSILFFFPRPVAQRERDRDPTETSRKSGEAICLAHWSFDHWVLVERYATIV